MKNFLRKLHIGDSAGGDGASSLSAPPPPPTKKGGGGGGEHKHASGLSGWLSSVTGRPHAPPPLPAPAAAATAAEVEAEENALATALASSVEERRAAREEESRKEAEDERKREVEMEKKEKREAELEDYHMQLALEMSVREDPEAMQIEVAKQISLGSCPLQSSPAEVVAFRYWSFNALSYDDKILDGFYDLCATGDEPTLSTIPSLMELQALPFSHGAKTEAVLVNRALDSELVALEQKAFIMTLEFRTKNSEFVGRTLVQTLANLVSNYMGGPVVDPESMLLKYRNMTSALRADIRSAVIPLGRLKVGLARHRALLFKVLADSIAVPCRLVKGRQYTGSDDGALNIVKFNDGRECIVDLMVDPGTLIPSDGADLGREVEDSLFVDDQHDSNTQLVYSFSEASSSIHGSFENESLEKGFTPRNAGHSGPYGATNTQTDNDVSGSGVSSSFEELSITTYASENVPIIHESSADHTMTSKSKDKSITSNNSSSSSPPSSEMGSTPAVRRKKVKDVSEYMISAAKENPQLAEKIHAVLLESGVVPPPDLFSEESKEQPKDLIVYDTSVFQTKDEMIRTMNELESTAHDCSGGHGPPMPHHPGHELKIVPYRTPLDLKPVQGLGVYHPFDSRDNAAPSIPLSEPSAPPQENPLQLIKQMPVTAAAVATAAVVASSMVVAAAKSNSDIKLDVPVAAAATAAAVVATTAAVNKQYEYLDPGCQLLCLPSSSTKSIQKGKHDLLENDQLDNALEHEKDSVQAPQEAERVSDRSTGTESARSEIALDDVAEFEIQWEDLTLGQRVGLGSFGEVYRGEWHGTEVAVKKFLQQDISSDALEEFRTEVGIMRRLRHPNVVLFMGAVTRVPHLSIVTEFLPRGSLFRLIRRPNNQLDERRRLRMALDVARGMNYLHNCTPVIVHRDLKSPNLLVDKNWVVKVCDFGLSRIKHNTFLSSRSTAGTAEWMAPEVLRNEPSDEKCDVFSYGVILWELCTLLQPWEGMNPMQVVGAVGFQQRRLDIPGSVDPAVAEIIKRCWQTDPRLRPSFSEIMAALRPLLKNRGGAI
ncbi:serine/threonine-protein kinase EDR1-like [Panicum miliaceum]|uniref:non-specific serine/threonine protein kinase n=1 Tax=Panicum miliaceum TaxID=4540 RepID=A0A3L6PAA8_PANMI|nr:serine/threonine-protein kinase EDR1-like [Panicum miliaceum]